MSFKDYEGTAIDTSILEEVQQSDEPETQTQEPEEGVASPEVDETTGVESGAEPEDVSSPDSVEKLEVPEEIEIPGLGKLSIEEIKEARQSGLRQADYTRKTQELARQREELKDAQELLTYLRANPQVMSAVKEVDARSIPLINNVSEENELIRKLAYNQKALEVDMELNQLRSKYGEIDEIALFQKATELGIDDLEFVLKGLQYESSGGVDVDKIVQEAKEAAKAELKAELEANKSAVSTTVSTRQSTTVESVEALSAQEKRVAEAMGMSEEEYRKWR